MKQTIMPTYEQLALKLVNKTEENEKLRKTIERLKKRPPATITKVVMDYTGWYALSITLAVIVVIIGLFIINEKY